MITNNETSCPECNGTLKRYDSVRRIVRAKGRSAEWIKIQRVRCVNCGVLHRELPDSLYPYKQYEAEIIRGVLEGFITADTLGYENYPCEATMSRWKAQKLHPLL